MEILNKLIGKMLGQFKNVENMESYKTRGSYVPNQYLISFENGTVFKSYNTIIAAKVRHNGLFYLFLDPKHDMYSYTTNNYTNQFTGMNVKERRNAIEKSAYSCYDRINVVNLNE